MPPASSDPLALGPVGPQHQVHGARVAARASLVSPFALRFTRTFIFALTFFSRAMSRRPFLPTFAETRLFFPPFTLNFDPPSLTLRFFAADSGTWR